VPRGSAVRGVTTPAALRHAIEKARLEHAAATLRDHHDRPAGSALGLHRPADLSVGQVVTPPTGATRDKHWAHLLQESCLARVAAVGAFYQFIRALSGFLETESGSAMHQCMARRGSYRNDVDVASVRKLTVCADGRRARLRARQMRGRERTD